MKLKFNQPWAQGPCPCGTLAVCHGAGVACRWHNASISIGISWAGVDDTKGTMVGTNVICIGVGVGVDAMEVCGTVQGTEELDRVGIVARA